MIKGIVNTFLNIRTGLPEINPTNNPSFYQPGEEIEIIDQRIGEAYKHTNVWYQLANGSFVWSGGVSVDRSSQANLFPRSKDITYWVDRFGLKNLPQRGAGVKLAILDSGIFAAHKDFTGSNIVWKDFVNNEPVPSDSDGHGTHCCGIVAGKGTNRIEGLAPFCDLLVGRIFFKRGLPSPADNHWFVDGLDWACRNADIISISIGVADKLWNTRLEKIIDDAVAQGKIIVCAIGNVTTQSVLDLQADYPAKYANCISVGALDINFELSNLTKRFDATDIHVPGEFITSASKNGIDSYREDSGTSMATPFVSGLLALKKQKDPSFDLDKARNFLHSISERKTINDFDYRAIKNQTVII